MEMRRMLYKHLGARKRFVLLKRPGRTGRGESIVLKTKDKTL